MPNSEQEIVQDIEVAQDALLDVRLQEILCMQFLTARSKVVRI